MKLFPRILILIFFFAFTIHEVRGNDFLRGIHVSQKNRGLSLAGKSTSQQFESDLIENDDFCSIDQDDNEQGEIQSSSPAFTSFHKYSSYLFGRLITEPIAGKGSTAKNAKTDCASTAAPRYILYHNLLIPFS